jgi:FixJ family two-component response regulator
MPTEGYHQEGLRLLHRQLETLTSVERELLDRIVSGETHEAICQELHVSPRLIANETFRFMETFGAVDLDDLASKVSLAQ